MRKESEKERLFLDLAGKLPSITEEQKRCAFEALFSPLAVYKMRKREVKCLCCGGVAVWDKPFIESFIDVDEYDCYYCGKSMPIKHYKDTDAVYKDRGMYNIITTFRGYQVVRTFEAWRYNREDGSPTEYPINEIFQTWIDDEGNEVITGRRLSRSPYHLTWDVGSPWRIREHNYSSGGQYVLEDSFDLTGVRFYSKVRVTKRLRRNGWVKGLMKYNGAISVTSAMRWLLTVPTAEMLVKTGQWDMFLWMVRNENRQMPFLHSVRIANRNGYVVRDTQMWLDYLGMAGELEMDTHNPKVVCPENLKDAHDAVLRRISRRRRLKEAEEHRMKALKYEERYRKAKGAYFGICFGDGDVRVRVLETVAEVAEEGEAMHHCVFEREYYKTPNVLLLSARDADGNRLETVELSLRTYKVLQSRGVLNGETRYHKEIISLVESNAALFKRVVR